MSSEGDAKNRDVTKVRDHQGSLDVSAAVSGAGSPMGGSQVLCLEEGMTPSGIVSGMMHTEGICFHSFTSTSSFSRASFLALRSSFRYSRFFIHYQLV